MSRRRLVLAGVAAALGLLLAAGGLFAWELRAPGGAGPPVIVEIPTGATLADVSRDLQSRGLLRRAAAFRLLARLRGDAAQLRAGEYAIAPSQSGGQVLDQLVEGRVVLHRLSIPEGLTAAEIAQRLQAEGIVDAKDFLAVVHDPTAAGEMGVQGKSLEGYLFPETYQLAGGLPAREVARTFVDEFLTVWKEIGPLAAKRGLSMHETVTLASIVEKETGVPSERPLVAAVFENRLKIGMRLETDPAVIYGIPHFDGNLRKSDLENAANPYNTYMHGGLPPGPIANPGEASLRAVVQPANVDYLYFVSRNDGTHQFSRTYQQHLAAVDRYQRKRPPQEAERHAERHSKEQPRGHRQARPKRSPQHPAEEK